MQCLQRDEVVRVDGVCARRRQERGVGKRARRRQRLALKKSLLFVFAARKRRGVLHGVGVLCRVAVSAPTRAASTARSAAFRPQMGEGTNLRRTYQLGEEVDRVQMGSAGVGCWEGMLVCVCVGGGGYS